MNDLQEILDNTEQAIERDAQSNRGDDEKIQTVKDEEKTLRQKTDDIIHSHKFMVTIICLVVLDCLILVAQLLIDLEGDHPYISKIFHYGSLSILSLFLLEIGLRIYVLRWTFFHHKFELFDAVVVAVSFILDIIFREQHGAANASGLLILLRLWRVTRIVNGIVSSVKKHAQENIELERRQKEMCEEKCKKLRDHCSTLSTENERLQNLLSQHKISFPTSKIMKPDGCGL